MVDYDKIDTQMSFEYNHKYKTMLRNKLFSIVLFKQLNVPYEINAEGKIYIDELMLLTKQRMRNAEEFIRYYGWDF